jgi:hypothetical protein
MNEKSGLLIEYSRIRDGIMRVSLFTNEDGLITGLFRTGKRANNKLRPLCSVNYQFSCKLNTDLRWFQNLTVINPLFNIYNDVVKQCIVLYMQELLIRSTWQNNPNTALFRFLVDSINLLDDSHRPANFPLWATMEIIRHQGFLPDRNQLDEMAWERTNQFGSNNLCREAADVILDFLPLEWAQVADYSVASVIRREATEMLIHFLCKQLDIKSKFHSVEILHDVLHA